MDWTETRCFFRRFLPVISRRSVDKMFKHNKKRGCFSYVSRFIVVFLVLLAIIIGFAYGRIEFLTWLHGNMFHSVSRESAFCGPTVYLKVFEYSDTSAKVLFVDQDGTDRMSRTRQFFTFKRNSNTNTWKFMNYNTVWSALGSAENWTWPPYF